jgi:hypothetical protein
VLDAKLEALADALIAKALQGDVSGLRVAIYQLVGRPTEVVQGNPDRPIRIVGESISSRRREKLADVDAEDTEVEELPPARRSSGRDARVSRTPAGGRRSDGGGCRLGS